jgi:hypothetical protein
MYCTVHCQLGPSSKRHFLKHVPIHGYIASRLEQVPTLRRPSLLPSLRSMFLPPGKMSRVRSIASPHAMKRLAVNYMPMHPPNIPVDKTSYSWFYTGLQYFTVYTQTIHQQHCIYIYIYKYVYAERQPHRGVEQVISDAAYLRPTFFLQTLRTIAVG